MYLPLPIGLPPPWEVSTGKLGLGFNNDVSESHESKLPLQRENMTSKVFLTTVESLKLHGVGQSPYRQSVFHWVISLRT